MQPTRFAPLLGLLSLLLVSPVLAVTRSLTVVAPPAVEPGETVRVVITAATDAKDGEEIGFLHGEYSLDGGRNWVPVYAEKLGRRASWPVDFKAGAAGSRALVRARAAFRGGKAGDVDFTGAPIAWDGSWGQWQSPPARAVTIPVAAR